VARGAEAAGAERVERPQRAPISARVGGWAGACFLRALRATLRLRHHDDATVREWERQERRFVLAFWHRHLLFMRYAYRGTRMTVLVSRSRDGELIAQVMARLGVATSRGSSSRGGAAGLRDLLRRARSGSDLGISPDGPRGPLRKVQPGVVLAAAATGLPVVPVAISASRRKLLRSWDRMLVPLPGSRLEIVYGEPLRVPRDARFEDWAPRIEQALNAAEARAERLARGARSEAAEVSAG
jgi:lysophospholipid acyltransferase (LPLAT)-like uncharacterized protein